MTNSWRERFRFVGVLLIAVGAVLFLSYSAVSSSPPPQPPPPTEIELSGGDEGSRVQLREGEVMVISLEANPSTGYGWEVQQELQAMEGPAILRQTGDQFVPQDDPRLDGVHDAEVTPRLGAPETQILRFQAVAAGETAGVPVGLAAGLAPGVAASSPSSPQPTSEKAARPAPTPAAPVSSRLRDRRFLASLFQ